jgi:hypothetical protein
LLLQIQLDHDVIYSLPLALSASAVLPELTDCGSGLLRQSLRSTPFLANVPSVALARRQRPAAYAVKLVFDSRLTVLVLNVLVKPLTRQCH